MATLAGIAVWAAWAALVLAGGVFALFCVAFGGDDPRRKPAAQRLVTVALVAYAGAVAVSYWLLAGRTAWWHVALGLPATLLHLPVIFAAIAVLYRGRKAE